MLHFRTLCILAATAAVAAASVVVEKSRMDMYSSMCAREQHGNLLADPYDCSQFIQCDYGHAEVKKCSPGLRYDTRLQVCNWPHLVQCDSSNSGGVPPINSTEGNVRCYGYDTLHFIADTRDCEKYYICANGVPYQHQCAPGIHWDYLNNQCENPTKAMCAGKGDNNQQETSTTHAPVTVAPTTVPAEVVETPDCSKAKYFSCQDSCSEYYVCISNVPYRMKCADGYYWNMDSVKCDLPELSRCLRDSLLI